MQLRHTHRETCHVKSRGHWIHGWKIFGHLYQSQKRDEGQWSETCINDKREGVWYVGGRGPGSEHIESVSSVFSVVPNESWGNHAEPINILC